MDRNIGGWLPKFPTSYPAVKAQCETIFLINLFMLKKRYSDLTRQPKPGSSKKAGKRKTKVAEEENIDGKEFHDDKSFNKFSRELLMKFPKLKDLGIETEDKNETLNLMKANQVHEAIVGSSLLDFC